MQLSAALLKVAQRTMPTWQLAWPTKHLRYDEAPISQIEIGCPGCGTSWTIVDERGVDGGVDGGVDERLLLEASIGSKRASGRKCCMNVFIPEWKLTRLK